MSDSSWWSEAGSICAHDPGFDEGAVVPPIYQTSLFTFGSYAEMRQVFAGETQRSIYSRVGNPSVRVFEEKLARLEGTEQARAFASGMAAISGTVLAHVASGDRIVAVRHLYPDAYRFFQTMLPKLGVTVDYVDGSDLGAIERVLPGAKLLYLESPTSWLFEVQDLAAIARLAKAAGVITVADNSWATPIFQRPATHGIDFVVHSASKYLSGHSDTVAGVVCGSAAGIQRLSATAVPYLGAKLAPFEAFLLLRGLRTLPARMLAQENAGIAVATALAKMPGVARVLHPTLAGKVDERQLMGSSSLFSFEAAPGLDIERFCDALRLFRLGVSWGGHESLVIPAAIAHEQAGGPNSVVDFGVSPRIIRLHVGLESADALIADLEQALASAGGEVAAVPAAPAQPAKKGWWTKRQRTA
ncbi:PLP-dependent transferase [Geminicoccus harenae]|uniref:PLP-dependent transferase n=1 Tax=Geminicoccus harenae TaxID=2498453 RepID=UPI00168A8347|nr:PLP-dependent transferase [Geminicoccus harenae]